MVLFDGSRSSPKWPGTEAVGSRVESNADAARRLPSVTIGSTSTDRRVNIF